MVILPMGNALAIRFAMAVLVAATFLSLPIRPFWVDEIYQLEATRDLTVNQVLRSSMVAPGGMPLGYLTQTLWLRVAGYSRAQARLPAALFGLGSVFVTAWIARRLSLNATLTIFLGLLTPLWFRYSTEARPYSQGLFFSVLSTALLIYWRERPTKARWFLYLFSNVAGIYSLPFSFFTVIAHVVYTFVGNRRQIFLVLLSMAFTAAAYAPWFLLSQHALRQEAWPHIMFFSWRQISPLMIVKEISGGGYVCSVSLLLLIFSAWRKKTDPLLVSCIIIPIVLAIAADARFGYFFAIRQLIVILPPLLLLASAAAESLWRERKIAVALLLGVYAAGALVKNVNWERRPTEDWEKAAAAIKSRLQATRGCVIFEPARDSPSYYYFEPFLRSHTCKERTQQYHSVMAVSPYASAEQRDLARNAENVGNTLITASAN